jgi:hypothetical protein
MHYARWVRKLGGAPPWQVIQVLINKTEGGFTEQMQVSAYAVHSCGYSLLTVIAYTSYRCADSVLCAAAAAAAAAVVAAVLSAVAASAVAASAVAVLQQE